ncbi:hypothetical protein EJB05_54608, partial [Eragrostis curvula]
MLEWTGGSALIIALHVESRLVSRIRVVLMIGPAGPSRRPSGRPQGKLNVCVAVEEPKRYYDPNPYPASGYAFSSRDPYGPAAGRTPRCHRQGTLLLRPTAPPLRKPGTLPPRPTPPCRRSRRIEPPPPLLPSSSPRCHYVEHLGRIGLVVLLLLLRHH